MGTEKGENARLSNFQFLANGNLERCPNGKQPSLRKNNKTRYCQGFELADCENCPLLDDCVASNSLVHLG